MKIETLSCVICQRDPVIFTWTDTHGIAACIACNAPYRIYHYDDNRQRVDKPAELLIEPAYIPVLQRYWQEKHARMENGCCFPGSHYDPMTTDEKLAFQSWFETNAAVEAVS